MHFVNSGLDGAGFQGHVAVDPRQNGVVLSAADVSGIHRTTDNGATWKTVIEGLYNTNHLSVAGLLFSPTNPDVVVACLGRQGSSVGGGVFISDDNGQTWSQEEGSPPFAGGNVAEGSGAASVIPNPHPRSTGRLAQIDAAGGWLYVGSYETGLWRAPFVAATGACGAFVAIGSMSGRFIRSLALDTVNQQIFIACRDDQTAADDGIFRVTGLGGAFPTTGVKLAAAPSCPEELFVLGSRVYCVAGGATAATPNAPGTRGVFSAGLTAATSWVSATGNLPTATPGSRWQAITGYIDGAGNHRMFVGCDAPVTAAIGSSKFGQAIWRCDDARLATPAWTCLTFLTDADAPRIYPTGETWWLAAANNSLMINKGAYDCAALALVQTGTADPTYLFSAGRSGVWRLQAPNQDPAGNWRAAVRGMAVTINRTCVADPVRPGVIWIGNTDWVNLVSTDHGRNFVQNKPSDNMCLTMAANPQSGDIYTGVGNRDHNDLGKLWSKATPTGPWVDTEIDGTSGAAAVTFRQVFSTATTSSWPSSTDANVWPATAPVLSGGALTHAELALASGGEGILQTGTALGSATRIIRYQTALMVGGSGTVRISRSADTVGGFIGPGMLTKGQWHAAGNSYYEFRIQQDAGGSKPVKLRVFRSDLGTLKQMDVDVDISSVGWAVDEDLWVYYGANDNPSTPTDVDLFCTVWTGTLDDKPDTYTFEFTDEFEAGPTPPPNAPITGLGGQGTKLITGGGQSNNLDCRWDDWSFDGLGTGGSGAGSGARVSGVCAGTVSGNKIIIAARQESLNTAGEDADPVNSGGIWRKSAAGAWAQILSPSVNGVLDNQATKETPMSWPAQTGTTQRVAFYDRAQGVWFSAVNGASGWVLIWARTSNVDRTGYVALDPLDVDTAYVSAGGDLYRIDDCNVLATNEADPLDITPPSGAGRMSAITVDHLGQVWASGNATAVSSPSLWRSSDRGATWTDLADDTYRGTALFPFQVEVAGDNYVYIPLNGNGVIVGDQRDTAINVASATATGEAPTPVVQTSSSVTISPAAATAVGQAPTPTLSWSTTIPVAAATAVGQAPTPSLVGADAPETVIDLNFEVGEPFSTWEFGTPRTDPLNGVTPVYIDRDSLEQIFVPVFDRSEGVDIDSLPVSLAVVPGSSRPTDADYLPAQWATVKGVVCAHVLQGPSAGLDLEPGEYNVHIKVVAPPEVPRRNTGPVIIT